MSILIKGMEMPKSCRYCEFRHMSITENTFCTAAHETIDYMMERTRRLDNCPLVEVQPHGDLVDRDDLLLKVERGDYETYNDYSITFDLIDCASTVIGVEEVKR